MSGTTSASFDRLDQRVQRWIWMQRWTELRDIQEQAIGPVLDERDLLLASATASGKTEAAFLPIASSVADIAHDQLAVLYVAPLKALINDQQRRLESLFASIDAAVTPWHGDVPGSQKRRLLERPAGVLLITPESLEALFVTRGTQTRRIFSSLRYIVVDELHAFIGTERGRQLQTLLHRVELAAAHPIPRIALSATMGDLDMAAEFLRPRHGGAVVRVESTTFRHDLQLQVRGSRTPAPGVGDPQTPADAEDVAAADEMQIAEHLYRVLRGGTHLVFANRRVDVERYADLLRRRCEQDRVPNEFWPHHGSLSRQLREDAEEILRSGRPATVLATTTLELGIDVGSVDSVAQLGPPPSVAAMRQRLGRSGRRADQASRFRIYVREPEIGPNSSVIDHLRVDVVQSVAAVRLLLQRWVEPPDPGALHLSTLVQQVLSLVAQLGGFRADAGYRALCATGPFGAVSPAMFAQFLRDLAEHDLITQTHDGEIVMGLAGERLTNHYEFYAAFASPEEWRLITGGRFLGTLPLTTPLAPDLYLVFGGSRWRILSVNEERHEVDLIPAAGGRLPLFGGTGAVVHERVRQEMRSVLMGDELPAYLDPTAGELLQEGRDAFRRFGLAQNPILPFDGDTLIFPWAGDRALNTLLLELRSVGFPVGIEGVALVVRDSDPAAVRRTLGEVADAGVSDPLLLAAEAQDLRIEKHHWYLSQPLLVADYASSRLDAAAAIAAARRLLASDVP